MLIHNFPVSTCTGVFAIPLALRYKQESFIGALALLNTVSQQYTRSCTEKYLNYQEQLEYDGFPERRKHSYLAGRVCAKEAMSLINGCPSLKSSFLRKGIYGFPIISSPLHCSAFQISISHCKRVAGAVVVPDQFPVGIDIEVVNKHIKSFDERTITKRERELIQEIDNHKTDCWFTVVWSAKEALSKVLRTGLTTPFHIYEIENIREGLKQVILTYRNFSQYKCIVFIQNDIVCAFTLPKSIVSFDERETEMVRTYLTASFN